MFQTTTAISFKLICAYNVVSGERVTIPGWTLTETVSFPIQLQTGPRNKTTQGLRELVRWLRRFTVLFADGEATDITSSECFGSTRGQ